MKRNFRDIRKTLGGLKSQVTEMSISVTEVKTLVTEKRSKEENETILCFQDFCKMYE